MAIVYYEETGQFFLHSNCTTYIIELLNGDIPVHAYWGKRLEKMPPLSQTHDFPTLHQNARDITVNGFEHSSGAFPLEYPTFGSGDMRDPAFHARYADGSRLTVLRYAGHTIMAGKPALPGLPATYASAGEADTLELDLVDPLTGLHIYLSYSVFTELDAIARSVRVVNGTADTVELLKVASANVDFYDFSGEMLHLPGYWTRERYIERQPISHSLQKVESRQGGSSHMHNPFFAVLSPDTNETAGEAFGFSLVYSGNFDGGVSKDAHGIVRATMGIGSFDFSWMLKPGESFQSPEAILVYSDSGLGQMSRRYHRLYRDHLCRGKYQHADRPVLVNNWEATYFDFDMEKLLSIADRAKELDIDMLVLDDGWFGKRNSDTCSLGDWVCNTDKLKGGLKALGDALNERGLLFGLWFEPEMVSPDSELYRKHPDWCIHIEGRPRAEARHQLTLDLSRKEVQNYVIQSVSDVLKSAPITYVKWDMNRFFSEIGSAGLDASHQAELPHRYMLGLYRVLEEITSSFPEVLFESCASGGGRFDPGMLYYMPQTWCSDDSDALERIFIQYGTSMVYPPVTMGAHVSVCPNHQLKRTTPFSMRGHVAMSGQFGYELDLSAQSPEDLAIAKEQVSFYKAHRHTIQQGDMYRLEDPFAGPFAAWEFISPDRSEVLLFTFVLKGSPSVSQKRVRLQGLDPTATYVIGGESYLGAYLMQVGLPFDRGNDYLSTVTVLNKE